MLRSIRCLTLAAALAILPLGGALADGPPSTNKAPDTEIRAYNVSDLIHEIPNYGTRPEPEKTPAGEGGLFSSAPGHGRNVGERTEDVVQTIQNLVQPDSWHDVGGTVGSIRVVNDCLIISQTASAHLQVQAMLDSLRRESDLDSMIEVNLRWLQLTAEELEAIQVKPATGSKNASRSVSLDAIKDENAVFCRARTLGFNGQAVTLKSGRMTDVVKNATPVVGTGAALYDIQMEREQSGITVQVTPRRSPDRHSIIVDIQSVVTQGLALTPPDTNASPRVPSTHPSDQGAAEATQALGKLINRGSRVEQSYNTTVRLTDGTPVLVGGMTLEPGRPGSRQLYLVVTANMVESPNKPGK